MKRILIRMSSSRSDGGRGGKEEDIVRGEGKETEEGRGRKLLERHDIHIVGEKTVRWTEMEK